MSDQIRSYRQRQLLEIAPMLDAIGEHGMAQDARELAADHTGLTASWCGICGDCTCENPEQSIDDAGCPLHGAESNHKGKST